MQFRAMPPIVADGCPVCEQPMSMAWFNIAQHALRCARDSGHASHRVPWTSHMMLVYKKKATDDRNNFGHKL